jgi:hypothetical protein
MSVAIEFVSSVVAFGAVWMLLAGFGVAMSLLLVQMGVGETLQGASGWTPSQTLWLVFLLLVALVFHVVFFAVRAFLVWVFARKNTV